MRIGTALREFPTSSSSSAARRSTLSFKEPVMPAVVYPGLSRSSPLCQSNTSVPKATKPRGLSPPASNVATSSPSVAQAKASAHHTQAHTDAINSLTKWMTAVFRALGKSKNELLDLSLNPNNTLASEVLCKLSEWYTSGITAENAGVEDTRAFILEKTVPRDNQRLAKCWMRRFINERRSANRMPDLPNNWAGEIAFSKSNARTVSKAALQRGAKTGAIYHS